MLINQVTVLSLALALFFASGCGPVTNADKDRESATKSDGTCSESYISKYEEVGTKLISKTGTAASCDELAQTSSSCREFLRKYSGIKCQASLGEYECKKCEDDNASGDKTCVCKEHFVILRSEDHQESCNSATTDQQARCGN